MYNTKSRVKFDITSCLELGYLELLTELHLWTKMLDDNKLATVHFVITNHRRRNVKKYNLFIISSKYYMNRDEIINAVRLLPIVEKGV